MRIGSRFSDVDERPKWGQFLLKGRDYGLGVIGNGHQHREIATCGVLANDLCLESGILPGL